MAEEDDPLAPFRKQSKASAIPEAPDPLAPFRSQLASAQEPGGLAKAFGAGIVRGAASLPGVVGDIRELVGKGVEAAGTALGLPKPDSEKQRLIKEQVPSLFPTSAQTVGALENVTGELYKPKTTGEHYAATVGEFLPGAALGPVRSLPANLLRYGAAPAVASESAGIAAQKVAPGLELPARIAAAIAAPGAASRIITPRAIAPEAKEMQLALQREGIEPTVGQVTGEKQLKFREAELAPELAEQQTRQFSTAVAGRIGLNELPTTGPTGNFTRRAEEIGQQFEDLTLRNTLIADNRLAQDLSATHREYHAIPGIHDRATLEAVDGAIRHISDALHSTGGTIPGDAYQILRSRLNKAAMDAADPQRSAAIRDIVEALDSGMERSIARTNPGDAGLWPQARRDYRNMLVLEKALGAAGPGAAQGIVSPAQVASAAKSIYGRREYLRGYDDFSELTQPAVSQLTPLPSSGTAERLTAKTIPKALSAGAGALLGHQVGHGTEGGVLGLLLGHDVAGPLLESTVNRVTRPFLMSAPGRAWQTNTILQRGQPGGIPGENVLATINMIRALQQGESPQSRLRLNRQQVQPLP